MSASLEVAGDVAGAGGALAGLILVYLAAVSASFTSYEKKERPSVLRAHRFKAWFGFIGLAFCLLAVALGLLGKWLSIPCVAVAAILVLLLALLLVIATALQTVLEIK